MLFLAPYFTDWKIQTGGEREWVGLALRAPAHQEGMEGPEELGEASEETLP